MKTLTKQKSHVTTVRDVDMSILQEICLMFHISSETYFKDQYAQYERFVEIAVPPTQMKAVRYSKLFRGFWNNEWAIRNKTFLDYCEKFKVQPDSKHCEDTYYNLHCAIRLAGEEIFMAKFEEIRRIILRKAGHVW